MKKYEICPIWLSSCGISLSAQFFFIVTMYEMYQKHIYFSKSNTCLYLMLMFVLNVRPFFLNEVVTEIPYCMVLAKKVSYRRSVVLYKLS